MTHLSTTQLHIGVTINGQLEDAVGYAGRDVKGRTIYLMHISNGQSITVYSLHGSRGCTWYDLETKKASELAACVGKALEEIL